MHTASLPSLVAASISSRLGRKTAIPTALLRTVLTFWPSNQSPSISITSAPNAGPLEPFPHPPSLPHSHIHTHTLTHPLVHPLNSSEINLPVRLDSNCTPCCTSQPHVAQIPTSTRLNAATGEQQQQWQQHIRGNRNALFPSVAYGYDEAV